MIVDGTCVIEIDIDSQATSDYANQNRIASTAWSIIDRCVKNEGKGGIFMGIG